MFEVWAPLATAVDVEIGEIRYSMDARAGGWWSAEVPGAGHGTDYRFRLDGGEPLPDPGPGGSPRGSSGPAGSTTTTGSSGTTTCGTAVPCPAR